jgi:hypothetical protein|tara:strand:- start:116 stop:277 length:162 start_codon:yes stop_codon:yes gene_type:complete
MIPFLMFLVNGMALVTIVLIGMTSDTLLAIPHMVIVFIIVMAINYLVMYLDEL